MISLNSEELYKLQWMIECGLPNQFQLEEVVTGYPGGSYSERFITWGFRDSTANFKTFKADLDVSLMQPQVAVVDAGRNLGLTVVSKTYNAPVPPPPPPPPPPPQDYITYDSKMVDGRIVRVATNHVTGKTRTETQTPFGGYFCTEWL